MNEYENNPIVISGPSGSGKTELINYVVKKYPSFKEATGMTTRLRRPGEGNEMLFVTRGEFESLIASDSLIEYCTFNGNYYGVPKSEFAKLKDFQLIFNVAYSSAREIKKAYDKTSMIYLMPPTEEELLRRLGKREYERYLIGIEETMANAFKFDYLLISQTNDLESTTDDFMDIANQKSEAQQRKLTLAKNRDFINNFYKKR